MLLWNPLLVWHLQMSIWESQRDLKTEEALFSHSDPAIIASACEDARIGRMPRNRIHGTRVMGFKRSDQQARLSPPNVHSRVCWISVKARTENTLQLTFAAADNEALSSTSKSAADYKVSLHCTFISTYDFASL